MAEKTISYQIRLTPTEREDWLEYSKINYGGNMAVMLRKAVTHLQEMETAKVQKEILEKLDQLLFKTINSKDFEPFVEELEKELEEPRSLADIAADAEQDENYGREDQFEEETDRSGTGDISRSGNLDDFDIDSEEF